MRYLKTYVNLFESIESNKDDVIQTVKDILLPISDMGYEISVVVNDELGLIIRVVSWGDKPLLITDEVKEEFMRMKDYLQSEGYNSIEALYHIATPGTQSSREIKEFDSFMKYESWQKVKIQNLLFVAKKDIII